MRTKNHQKSNPHWSRRRGSFTALSPIAAATALCLLATTSSTPALAAFNYGEALQKSIYFYDAQRSGSLPPRGNAPTENRVEWRGDSGVADGADHSVDLEGGFYDAGDHVKFGFPMASSLTLLAWGVVENREAYELSGQLPYLLDNLRWGTDYLLKAHTAPSELWGQVGDGDVDHAWWGPAEVMQMSRPSAKIDSSCGGSDLAGETAAALAASAMVFETSDPGYADELVQNAIELYSFAETVKGQYSNCITDAAAFYRSWSGYQDELVWGALWLYRATGQSSYLSKAITYAQSIGGDYKWTHGWDDKSYGSFVLLAMLTGDASYRTWVERWLDYWTVGYNGERITYTAGGLAYLDGWGALRYSANTAFLASLYSDYLAANGGDTTRITRYYDFALGQLDYMLGDNPRSSSYLIGFGNNPPRKPHHRTSHGSWSDNINEPVDQRHVLYGGLVGGPDVNDQYTDSRSDYQKNEVALDYNAAFVGLLARIYADLGGAPVQNFPPAETRSDEVYVLGSINASGSNFTEVKAVIQNRSGWPARMTDGLLLRYYFTLEPGVSPNQITLSSAYNQCKTPTGPYLYSGDVYYAEVSCVGIKIYPGGSSVYQKEIQLRLTSAGSWNPSNDYSYSGLAASGSSPVKTTRITLYEDGIQIWGYEPDGSGPGNEVPTPTPDPDATPTPEPTPVPPTPTPTLPPDPSGMACQVVYNITDDWGNGFVTQLMISNVGMGTIDGWKLEFTFSGNQLITNAWNMVVTQSGQEVDGKDAGYNAQLSQGASTSAGFQGSYSGTNRKPERFFLNGVECNVDLNPDPTPTATPTPTPTPTPEPTPEPTPDPPGCGATWARELNHP